MFLRRENAFSVSIEHHAQEVYISEDALNNLSTEEIYRAILQLPAGYRTVFNLFEIEGYSHKEIATMLQISEGTSKSQLSKAKNWLQQHLKKNETHEQRKIQ
jgi:RNA polymerase sigma factor (sigma-70 family)